MLAVTGGDDRGKRHFLAIAPDTRKSTHSWQHQLADRGPAIPRPAAADGATGLRVALTKVFPKTGPGRLPVELDS